MKVKMLGVFRNPRDPAERIVEVQEGFTVRDIIEHLIDDNQKLRRILWDKIVDSPLPNALIILDGIEVNNLKGLETPVSEGQELVLLSVVHGG